MLKEAFRAREDIRNKLKREFSEFLVEISFKFWILLEILQILHEDKILHQGKTSNEFFELSSDSSNFHPKFSNFQRHF